MKEFTLFNLSQNESYSISVFSKIIQNGRKYFRQQGRKRLIREGISKWEISFGSGVRDSLIVFSSTVGWKKDIRVGAPFLKLYRSELRKYKKKSNCISLIVLKSHNENRPFGLSKKCEAFEYSQKKRADKFGLLLFFMQTTIFAFFS